MKASAIILATAAVASAGIADNYFINSPQYRVGQYIQDSYKNDLTTIDGLRGTILAQPRGANAAWIVPYIQRYENPAGERDTILTLLSLQQNARRRENIDALAILLGRNSKNEFLNLGPLFNPMYMSY
jgi:hypothetical protein